MKNKKVKEEAKPLRLNLACGSRPIDGFLGVDIAKAEGVDIVANILEFPWKFAKENSVDEIVISHFIEHIPLLFWSEGNKYSHFPDNGALDLFDKFFEECWRVLKTGGKITIIAPYYSSIRCWQDPTHRRAISEASFLYLNREWRKVNLLEHCHGQSNFDFSWGYAFNPKYAGRNEEFMALAASEKLNAINDIQVTLTKLE